MTRSLRLLAGALVLALPLAAAAGCGAEKKKTVKQELSSAQDHLADSKAASFTLRFADAKGSLARSLNKDGEVPDAVVQALLKGSVTYVADPAGDATLRSAQSSAQAGAADLKKAFEKVNLAFVIRDDKAELVELRLLGGVLYAHVNLEEVNALAKAGGVDDLDSQLDENLGAEDPRLAKGLADVRAGKWLKLPLSAYLDQLKDLAGSMTGSPSPGAGYDFSHLGSKALAAVKPYVTVTDANDSSKDRVLDVKVRARPALKALVGVLRAEKALPFAGALAGADAEIDKAVKDGVARGTITLHDSHLTQFAVDLESLRQLATDSGTNSFAGVKVVVDVDDSVDELAAPGNVSSVDLGAVLQDLLGSFFGAGTGMQSEIGG